MINGSYIWRKFSRKLSTVTSGGNGIENPCKAFSLYEWRTI